MNDTDIDFEDQVRRMLSDRAADISDRPRRELLAISALRPDVRTPRSRRRVHVAVAAAAAAAVFAAVMAGLVLRPDDTNDISTGPADSPDQPTGPVDGPVVGSGFVVWPNEATTADRTSAIAAATSFATEVVGLAPTTVTPDPEAAPDGPTWVELELDAASVRLLAIPTEDGWVVIQVGDGGPSISADPPTAHVAPVAGATEIEIRIDTTRGLIVENLVADVDDVSGAALGRALAEGYTLEAGFDEIRSIIVICRDNGGAVLDARGGHYG